MYDDDDREFNDEAKIVVPQTLIFITWNIEEMKSILLKDTFHYKGMLIRKEYEVVLQTL